MIHHFKRTVPYVAPIHFPARLAHAKTARDVRSNLCCVTA